MKSLMACLEMAIVGVCYSVAGRPQTGVVILDGHDKLDIYQTLMGQTTYHSM